MSDQPEHGITGWILPGLAVVLLSAKLTAAFWPQLTSLATTVRDRAESLFEADEEPAAAVSETESPDPASDSGAPRPIVIEQPSPPCGGHCRHAVTGRTDTISK